LLRSINRYQLYSAIRNSLKHIIVSNLKIVNHFFISQLQRLKNKVLCTTGKFARCTPIRDLHMAFILLYVYDYITKLCRQQAAVIQNHENGHVHSIGKGEARQRKYKRLHGLLFQKTEPFITTTVRISDPTGIINDSSNCCGNSSLCQVKTSECT
jgi:hypothetical protein